MSLTKVNSNSTRTFHDTLELLSRSRASLRSGECRLGATTTGFVGLNKGIVGFMPGQMTIIGAVTGAGKTALALSMIVRMIQGVGQELYPDEISNNVLYLSLEMSAASITQRLLSIFSGISLSDITSGSATEEQIYELDKARERNIHVMERISIVDDIRELDDIISTIKHETCKWSCVFVDSLESVRPSESIKELSRSKELSEICTYLRNVAIQQNIPIVSLAQLNRPHASRDNKEPQITDISESSHIENVADVVILLHRDYYCHRKLENEYMKEHVKREAWLKTESNIRDKAILIVEKNRNGCVCSYHIRYDEASASFYSL